MERLVRRKNNGITAAGLGKLGLLLVVLGVAGRAILQNGMLGMADGDSKQLLDLLASNPDAMSIAAVALILQAVETCAVPIFAFLLVEGFLHAENLKDYFSKILMVALVTELPFNLAMSGKLLDFSSRNPVLGLALGIVMMSFYRRYSEKGFKSGLIKLLITAAAFLWCAMLKIYYGESIIILVAMLWMCRNKPNLRILFGFSGTVACYAFSPFFLVAPMALLAVHYYNGEPGEQNDLVRFWAYPVALAVLGAVGLLVF